MRHAALRRLAVLATAVVLCCATISSPSVRAEPASPPSLSTDRPFLPGERLTYALTWLNIRAGTAVLEVAGAAPVQGRATLRLLTTAVSSPLVTKFYPVDNRVESLVDAEKMLPHRMWFRRREGKRNNDFDVAFDQATGTITSIKDGVMDQLPLPPQTYDSIACLYYVRTLPVLVPGASVTFNVHHDKKTYKLEIRVEAVETIKGSWGEVETVRVLAVMPFQGIFLNEGNIRIWFTNDSRRVPVRMRAKVKIGSVVASLVEGFQVPGAP
nr:DUF3108 domain-containing protein [Nitrospirota bacterium]